MFDQLRRRRRVDIRVQRLLATPLSVGAAAAAAIALLTLLGASPSLPAGRGGRRSASLAAALPTADGTAESVAEASPALRDALTQLRRLRADTENAKGQVLPNFGQQAETIVADAVKRVGAAEAAELESAIDGALSALFQQQLATLRHQLITKFSKDSNPATALLRADEQFAAVAEGLVRPGSSWSFELEREQLRSALKSLLVRELELARQRLETDRSRRATTDVVGQLQLQLERLGEMLHGAGGGAPLVFWTTYQLPGTPVQVSGRYSGGRANIELNLAPAGDPANGQAGFVTGLTPQNLGLSVNVGF